MRGDELLATLAAEAAADRPLAAMLRHAARHAIADPERPELAELTVQGWADAEAFGARLTAFPRVRLVHSPVRRCAQTVEGIARGAARAGVAVEILGPNDALGIAYIRDRATAGRLSAEHGDHFVRLWFEGRVPPHIVESPRALAEQKLAFVRERWRSAAPGTLDLHVSHDWNIIALREHWTGVRHEDAGWLTFLDGVTFRPDGPVCRVRYRDAAREVAAT
jgi:broad specificity phosphatase PhoE